MPLAGARVLLTADGVGGVWTHALDLAAGLAERGARVRLAVLGPPPSSDALAGADRHGIEMVLLPHPLEWLAADAGEVRAAARAIGAAARDWGADLVHLHSPAFALADMGCPVVATNHSCVATWWAAVRGGGLPPDLAWRAELVREGLGRADVALAPSRSFAADTARAYGLARVPLAVLNGRAAPDAESRPEPVDALFTAGRLWDEGKNVVALDRVAPLLPWPVRAAGAVSGPDGSHVDLRHVEALGPLGGDRVRDHLARRPIYVAPARFEPFGLAVLEAAQAGCALVLNDIASFRELWGGAALFAPADDAATFAGAIRALIDDPARREALGAAARERAGRYTVARMVEATAAAYARCLAREAAMPA